MKIGRGPKRFGGPSPEFIARKAAEQAAKDDAAASVPPRAGGVRIFLDDERKPAKGWTLARSPKALRALIGLAGEPATPIAERVTELSLDWHLGKGIENGEVIADQIAARLRADPGFLPAIELITCHSSDVEKGASMARTIAGAIIDSGRYGDVMVDVAPR